MGWARAPDEEIHGFAQCEVKLIRPGPSRLHLASCYAPEVNRAPTWNFTTARCYGIPQLLDEEQ